MVDINVFPHFVYAKDVHCFVDNPKLAVDLWHRLNKNKTAWYAVDLEILSSTAIRIHVRTIADSFSGGIGRVIETYECGALTSKEQAELDKVLLGVYTEYAQKEYSRRQEEEEREAIVKVRQELFGV